MHTKTIMYIEQADIIKLLESTYVGYKCDSLEIPTITMFRVEALGADGSNDTQPTITLNQPNPPTVTLSGSPLDILNGLSGMAVYGSDESIMNAKAGKRSFILNDIKRGSSYPFRGADGSMWKFIYHPDMGTNYTLFNAVIRELRGCDSW